MVVSVRKGPIAHFSSREAQMNKQSPVPYSRRRNRHRVLFAVLVAIALAVITDGLMHWAIHLSGRFSSGERGPAGLVLILLGTVQLSIARRLWTRPAAAERLSFKGNSLYWRWLLSGAVACFLLTLSLGAGSETYLASVAGWYTLTLLPLVVTRTAWEKLAAARRLGSTGNLLFAAALALIAAEFGARLYGWIGDQRLDVMHVARQRALPPNTEFRGQAVNRLGYWGEEFESQPQPGVFRIAAVGDGVMLSGTAETNFLMQVKRRMPHVEVYNFGIPEAGPREYAAQVACDIANYRPHLVLAFFSVGNDVTHELPVPGCFEWQGLGLYQLALRLIAAGNPSLLCYGRDEAVVDDAERYLREAAASLSVCRTPIDEQMHRRWQVATEHLSDLIQQCQDRSIPAALVIVPGEFQVNRALRAILQRRAGYKECQLDLELPQRRLAVFGEEQRVPVIDLLPHLARAEEFPYCRNDRLWNDLGNSIAADVLGNWLDQRYGAQIATLAHTDGR